VNAARHNSGFSLIEIMVAILILGIGLVGLTEGIATALQSTKESELQTSAVLIAAGQMETLRAEGLITDGVKEGDCGEELPLYRWRRTISRGKLEGLHEVEVVVENANTGKAIYDLRTMIFEKPSDTPLTSTSGRKDSTKSNRSRGNR